MKDRIEKLNDEQAIFVLKKLTKKWLDSRGFEVYSIVSNAQYKSGIYLQNLPSSLIEDDAKNEELGMLSKYTLEFIVGGDDDEVIDWTNKILKEVEETKAQSIDPITLGVIGICIIGLVLAARVKKIGRVEFYKGVPREVVNLVKAGLSINVFED